MSPTLPRTNLRAALGMSQGIVSSLAKTFAVPAGSNASGTRCPFE